MTTINIEEANKARPLPSDELPEGWESTSLRVLATLKKGKKPNKLDVTSWPGAVPYIDIEAFEKGNIRRYADPASSALVNVGDLLVVWDGARCGHVGKAPVRGALGSTLGAIEPILVHSDYLLRFLQLCHDTVNSNPRGIGIPHVEPELFWNLEVPVAPLSEQKRIVAKVEQLLTRVNATKERMAKVSMILKRFRQAVLAAACSGRLTDDWRDSTNPDENAQQFLKGIGKLRENAWKAKWGNRRKLPAPSQMDSTDLPDIPNSWEWASADSVCAQITDGEHIQPSYQSAGHPMLSAKHVRDGYVACEGAGLISEADFNRCLQRCAPEQGDILVVSVGATTGRSAIVENCPPFVIVRSVLLLKPLLPARFFLRWTQSPWCFTWMTRASGASAQPHLYIKDIKRMPVPVPPFAEQQEIVRRVGAMLKLADAVEKRVAVATLRAKKLTQAILAKAFRGELVPTEAELALRECRPYETASELLARIQSERESKGVIERQRRNKTYKGDS